MVGVTVSTTLMTVGMFKVYQSCQVFYCTSTFMPYAIILNIDLLYI